MSTAVASSLTAPAFGAAVKFPGHKPGKVYLGMNVTTDWAAMEAKTGPPSLRRIFGKWDSHTRQLRTVATCHSSNKMPWVSFHAPSENANGWRQVASGALDADLRARARDYKALAKPVILTFHHEPGDGGTQAEGKDYAAAWCRIYDVFSSEGALANVCMAPILSDWLFQPRNGREDPADWVTKGMLTRLNSSGFLGVDVYQDKTNWGFAERLGWVLEWTAAQGYPNIMTGVGEAGSCTYYGASPKPENWLTDSWSWCVANPNRVAAVSWFNSTANSKTGHNWRLDEPEATKLSRFRAALASPIVAWPNS